MRRALLLALLLVVGVVGFAGPPSYAEVEGLPSGTDVDYQLGGAAPMPPHVGIIVRDRHAKPAPGRYNVCYVNGFQTQPDEKRFWRARWWLVLKQNGRAVVDEAWGEWLLDIRTARKRRAIAMVQDLLLLHEQEIVPEGVCFDHRITSGRTPAGATRIAVRATVAAR